MKASTAAAIQFSRPTRCTCQRQRTGGVCFAVLASLPWPTCRSPYRTTLFMILHSLFSLWIPIVTLFCSAVSLLLYSAVSVPVRSDRFVCLVRCLHSFDSIPLILSSQPAKSPHPSLFVLFCFVLFLFMIMSVVFISSCTFSLRLSCQPCAHALR
ncbi:uncharacterized protein BJ171DRAFT_40390 [Polychytrium aggregatum]|uniref:uncharacterized protein n=1 Tax=Polychytrium aggregatum TaxID=110093 RepID=UPI0022FF37E0|nr:uncharacterized protein BJ171DRAFT_40390 [Polychytrium aggregatum]KAI9206059.1 hypothetical protein BJ171DRAFT_40390 [Polychytrium aggregatum]